MNGRDCAAAIAAYGLPGSRLTLPRVPLGQGEWTALCHEVRHQRVSGFLAQAVCDGAFAVTDEQVTAVAMLHRESMHVALALERLLLETVRAFTAAGIECRILKGPAEAHLTYSNPSLRSFGDVDILVPAAQYDAAADVLRARGLARRFTEPRPGFDRRFGKGVAFVSSGGFEVDLHRTFVHGPFGLRIRLEELFARASPFRIGSETLLALGKEERFLHACFHAALGAHPPRLAPLRDVAEMLLHASLDVAKVRALSASWRAEAVVANAVTVAWERLALADVLPLTVWANGYEPSRWERAALSVYTSRGRRYPVLAAAGVSAVPGILEKGNYVACLLFPDASYLQGRDRSYAHRLLRAIRVFARTTARLARTRPPPAA